MLEAKGELKKISGAKSETAGFKEKEAKASRMDQGMEMSQEQLAVEKKEALEAAQTMKELDKEKEG